jgi:hypothetical protein
MKAKGMRGALIWDLGALIDPEKIIPPGPAMLGKESLNYFSLALEKSHELDLDLGWVASSSWNAGGEWVTKEDASKELISSRVLAKGPSLQKILIKKPESELGPVTQYFLIESMAIPYSSGKEIDFSEGQVILLNEFTQNDSLIEWTVPAGEWEIVSFFMSNTGQGLVVPVRIPMDSLLTILVNRQPAIILTVF